MFQTLLLLAVFAPFVAFLSGIAICRKSSTLPCVLSILGVAFSASSSVMIVLELLKGGAIIKAPIVQWIAIGDFSVFWELSADRLTAFMLIIITSVSLLVHVYSIGYMAHDERKGLFFCFLSLFTFFMMLLVSSNNLLQMFCGWEGVGLSSYLLIGFWNKKNSAAEASMKAFIINRIGDFGLISGIAILLISFGTLNIYEIKNLLLSSAGDTYVKSYAGIDTVLVVCILMFIGCMAKSAQIGLHVWLPDAMEGPTPVSALMHAATMVTAGIFLMARCSFLYSYHSVTLVRDIIMIVGAVTSLVAAMIALTMDDIKKVIAYSTCSQLGYMCFACGANAYDAAMFHLMTHAYFKALLFLGAGNVIHLTGTQSISRMGGVYKYDKMTFMTFLIGTISISGIFPFAGYFSKDYLLASVYGYNTSLSSFVYFIGVVVAGLTALYSFKLLFLVFFAKDRKYDSESCHKPSLCMQLPLLLLSIGAFAAGFLKSDIVGSDRFLSVLSVNEYGKTHPSIMIELLPLICGICGVFVAVLLYLRKDYDKKNYGILTTVCMHKFYVDEFYDRIRLYIGVIARYIAVFDKMVLDKILSVLLLRVIVNSGNRMRIIHNGKIHNYLWIIFVAMLIVLFYPLLGSWFRSF